MMIAHRFSVPLALVFVYAASSFTFLHDDEQEVDLSRLVIVGDSLSAGFQNGSLMVGQQENGFPYVVAWQAGVELALPLVHEPGIPNVLTLVDPGPPPVIVPRDGVSAGRIDPFLQPTNLAVPGHTAFDALQTRPDFLFDDLTDIVLGLPGAFTQTSKSQVEWAECLQPTTVFIWLGNNDTLGAALAGDASLVTPREDFRQAYAEVMERMEATGATLVVANIPDVTLIPYLSTAEEVADLIGAPLELIGPLLGIGPGDFVTPDAFEQISAILGGFIPGPLTPDVVLDSCEVHFIQRRTRQFNRIIRRQAARHGAAFVNTNRILGRIADRGFEVGDQTLTVDFLGGIFSLDGFHPTNTGYAIVANAFIRKLNRKYEANIPLVSIEDVAAADPLVFPPFEALTADPVCSMSYRKARAFREVMRPRD